MTLTLTRPEQPEAGNDHPPPTILAYAGRPHYQQQLQAVIDLDTTGRITETPGDSIRYALVASRADARAAHHTFGLPTILLEHGVGQSYIVGSLGRVDASGDTKPDPNVIAHLAPNQYAIDAAARNLPNATPHIIGSPWLHHLSVVRQTADRTWEREQRPTLVVYMPHWNPPLTPAARGSWPWAATILRAVAHHVGPGNLTYAPHPRHNMRPDTNRATRKIALARYHHREAIADATHIITDNTSMGWETMALGIPTIWLQPPAYDHAWQDGHGIRFPGPGHIPIVPARTPDDTLTQLDHYEPRWGQQYILDHLYPTQNNLPQRLTHALQTPNQPQPDDMT